MVLTKEQAGTIKQQLSDQVKNSSMENKDQVMQHIADLDEAGVDAFMKQNNIPNPYDQGAQGSPGSPSSTDSQPQANQCIFCSIIKNEVPSHKLAENDKSMAILELNPLSKGHSIILPKSHVETESLPKSSMTLAQKVAKKIKKKLKAQDVKIETSNFQGHAMINIIPIYENAKFEKRKAEEPELQELQKILETKKRAKRTPGTKTSKSSSEKMLHISSRIP
ncbi:HIT domain-containing protein [Candidatus Pacearchaeota archaeon]|nr:HIT domain-containing protein [Candidatus Pacearchaeota archaeon]